MALSKPSFLAAKQPWHHWEVEQVLTELQSQPEGLSYVKARQRLRVLGSNKLPRKRKSNQIFLQPFANPLTYGLLVLAIIVQYFGGDGWAIVAIGIVEAGLGIGLTFWSVKTKEVASLGRMQKRLSLPSTEVLVRRDGEEMYLPTRDLVVGDIIILQPGDRPSVDVRLIETEDLQVNQAELGGEAIAIKQSAVTLEPDTPDLERSNLVYAGTEVTSGRGVGVVIATGRFAYWQSASALPQTFSAVHKQLRKLRQVWAILIGLELIAIAGLGWYYHLSLGWSNVLAIAVALTISTYPQQFLRLATLAQLLGMKALAKQRLWIKSPMAMDALGRLTIITLILESDTALSADNLARAGIQWRGLIRASEADANALGEVLGIPVNSYFEAPLERIHTWQSERESVAVIGKDAEDIPLLQQADISISDRGCPKLVQDSSSLILPRDNLHYLPVAIAEGRSVFDRLWRTVFVYLTGVATLSALVLLALATQTAVIPLQLLWLGGIVIPCVAFPLIVEPTVKNIMAIPAQRFQSLLQTSNYIRFVFAVMIMAGVTIGVFWLKYQGVSSALAQARTMAFTTLVLSQAFHTASLCRRSLIRNIPMMAALSFVVLIQVLVVQGNVVGELLGTVPLDYVEWAIAALAATSIFWFQELFSIN